ncbi:MFS transporter [Geosporobacter ferrireducens]|uniref:MFS transporter n=1 Tax=Geosporobacter ferrireducens TaxID=1424294 RepID=A0A1D8GHG7_9FIRM|nr:MFS transporter [Geosporobacter ferrireducens]AOT70351.1 MFS transporter [Geosporobacter ferrireducens]MTI54322.1 MFS transporter [Geosporobacter ferrireducens]
MKDNWKKNIFLFLLSQTLSLFGSSLVQYAIMWYITLNTKSGLMMTISIICGFLPTFFISPFAGVWADRYNRKILIMLSDSFIAVTTLLLAILFLLGYGSMGLLFTMSAFRAIGSGIQTPAIGAFIPQIVPEDKLTKVNGINGSIQSIVMLTSPMLSGALLMMATIEAIFFIDVVTAAIAVWVLLFFLKMPAHAKAQNLQQVSYFKDMREGIVYIRDHTYVRKFFVFCAFFFFLAAPVAFLTPLQVTRSFGDDVWRLTAIEITFSLGMMLGGMIIASWGGFSNKIYTMTFSSFVIGICTIALGIVPVFWIYLLIMGIVGISMPLFNTPSTVLLQEKVEADFLGRVFGVLVMISSSMMPLGMLVFGPIADMIRIEWLLIGTGFLLFIQSFFLIGSKDLVEAGKPQNKPNQN